jgi:hypothetical protein
MYHSLGSSSMRKWRLGSEAFISKCTDTSRPMPDDTHAQHRSEAARNGPPALKSSAVHIRAMRRSMKLVPINDTRNTLDALFM